MNEFRKRRFKLACFFSGVATIALFTDKLSGGEWVAAMTVILGLYAAAAWKQMKND